MHELKSTHANRADIYNRSENLFVGPIEIGLRTLSSGAGTCLFKRKVLCLSRDIYGGKARNETHRKDREILDLSDADCCKIYYKSLYGRDSHIFRNLRTFPLDNVDPYV